MDQILNQFSKHLCLFIKPTMNCNLNCVYCMHQNRKEDRTLSIDDVNRLIKVTFPHYMYVNITWIGGEPLLMGIDFFQNIQEIIKKESINYDVQVRQYIQTNGILLDDQWLNTLISNDVSIGISYDGCYNNLRGGTKDVQKSFDTMTQKGQRIGIITVVTKLLQHDLIDYYTYVKAKDIDLQLNFFQKTQNVSDEYLALDAKSIKQDLANLFIYWIMDKDCNIRLDPFEAYLESILESKPAYCVQSSCMLSWLCLDPTGYVTPCDRISPDVINYGHISKLNDIREVYNSTSFITLLYNSKNRRDHCKAKCEYYKYCNGGCNWDFMTDNNEVSCLIFKTIIDLLLNYLNSHKQTLTINPRIRKLILQYNSEDNVTVQNPPWAELEKGSFDELGPALECCDERVEDIDTVLSRSAHE